MIGSDDDGSYNVAAATVAAMVTTIGGGGGNGGNFGKVVVRKYEFLVFKNIKSKDFLSLFFLKKAKTMYNK